MRWEDSELLLSWIDVLDAVSVNASHLLPLLVIPQALLVEYLFGEQLASLTPVIYCHTASGVVRRHTLFCAGRAQFTRVPAVSDHEQDHQVARQIEQTIDFLRSEKMLDDGVKVRTALPPNSSALIADQLSLTHTECVLLSAGHVESGAAPVPTMTSDVSEPAGWLRQVDWGSASVRRQLLRYNVHRSASDESVSTSGVVRRLVSYLFERHAYRCLIVTPLDTPVVSGSWQLLRFSRGSESERIAGRFCRGTQASF